MAGALLYDLLEPFSFLAYFCVKIDGNVSIVVAHARAFTRKGF